MSRCIWISSAARAVTSAVTLHCRRAFRTAQVEGTFRAVQLQTLLGRWWVALVACGVLAAVVLLPGIGRPGLWEPVERQVADRVAPPLDAPPKPQPAPPVVTSDCSRTIPKDAVARTLSARAIEFGRDTFGDSDGGRRLPLALL